MPTETGRKYIYGHLAFAVYQGPEEATGALRPVGRELPWSAVGASLSCLIGDLFTSFKDVDGLAPSN